MATDDEIVKNRKTGDNLLTNLTSTEKALIKSSPTLMKDLKALKDANWKLYIGGEGEGSRCEKKAISIGLKHIKTPESTVQLLSHEVGHALYKNDPIDHTTKYTHALGKVRGEGAATIKNLEVRREILENTGVDIGIAGNYKNHSAYLAEYEKIRASGDTKKSYAVIERIYGERETVSGSGGKTYNEFYHEDWEKNYGAKNLARPPYAAEFNKVINGSYATQKDAVAAEKEALRKYPELTESFKLMGEAATHFRNKGLDNASMGNAMGRVEHFLQQNLDKGITRNFQQESVRQTTTSEQKLPKIEQQVQRSSGFER